MINDIPRAYSVLGLAPGVSAPAIRQRCRIMLEQARRDATGEQRVADILEAYRTIRRHYRQVRRRVSISESCRVASRPLTSEEIEAITDGIGNEPLLEPFLWPFRWCADLLGRVTMVWSALDLAGLVGLIVWAALSRQPHLFFGNEYAVFVALLFLAVGAALLFERIRSRLSR